MTNSTVSRVLFEPGSCPLKATGVEFLNGGKKYVATTKGEVILAAGKLTSASFFHFPAKHEVAGAFQSPQILELSGQQGMMTAIQEHSRSTLLGIGNKEILSSFGIETLVDLPNVGENLREW